MLVDRQELAQLEHRAEVTLIDKDLPARSSCEMWVDESFAVQYQDRAAAERQLAEIAKARLAEAEGKFKERAFLEADRLASVAICANDRLVAPLVIKAAIARAQGRESTERLMERLAGHAVDEQSFRRLVDKYAGNAPVATPKPPTPCRPMFAMACAH